MQTRLARHGSTPRPKTWREGGKAPRTTLTVNCPRNDIVLLPILFTDLSSHKVRPAIVIGHGPDPCDIFVVPVTSRLQQTTFPLRDWKSRGLNDPSAVNGQLATVETKLVRRVTGRLDKSDAANLDRYLRQWLKLGSSK